MKISPLRAVFAFSMLLLTLAALPSRAEAAQSPAQATETWFEVADGELRLNLYFFWSSRCPHCQEARPEMERMAGDYPWLALHSREILGSEENRRAYAEMAQGFGQEASSVPAFFFCGGMLVGYDGAETTGAFIRQGLQQCREQILASGAIALAAPQQPLTVPLLGELDVQALSLPVLTVAIGSLDAFNPCAFFVLLFLLSLMVHAGSRRRMLLIGGVFVFCSGLVYFLFMAAWLNLFLLVGQLRIVTAVAGAVAVAMALFSIKDYLRPGVGPSLSIRDTAKPGLYERMRGLLRVDHLPTMLLGTVALALAVNSYELLCTSGLPMVYTRILTLEQLQLPIYYLYLALYNLVYVLPLLTIVIVFTHALGSRKLQAREGQLLKLLSGLMMLGLGGVLLLAPEWLDSLLTAFLLVAAALLLTALAYLHQRRLGGRRGG